MTKIEWTHRPGSKGETWNPVVGCTVVSPGCTNCYAMRQARRLAANPTTPHYAGTVKTVNGNPVWTGKVALAPESVLTKPLRWREPRTIFVNSMGDLFHEDVPDDWRDMVFGVMAQCPKHQFQVLTKRPEIMREYFAYEWRWPLIEGAAQKIYADRTGEDPSFWLAVHDLPNCWLGTSIEDKARLTRLEHLRATPAAVRFISAEPLLGPLDGIDLTGVDWVICGGESGPGARPMHPDWARSLRDQCQAAGVPFFFKQWGAWAPGECCGGPPTRTEETAAWWADEWQFDRVTPAQGETMHRDDEPDLYRVGKTRAGRELDGRTWDQYPEVAA